MLTKQQVKQRVNYLGGGDAAAILGLSRFRTALEVWAIKAGQIIPTDISQEMPVKLGNMLEDTVCKLFEEETGKKTQIANASACEQRGLLYVPNPDDTAGPVTILNREHSFIGGNLDGFVEGERALFEAKTTNSFKQSEWESKDEIPVEYQIQCHHYLMVTGLDRAYIGCLIGNRKFVWRIIERNDKLLANMLAKEIAFWQNFVVPKVMPMQITSEDGGVLCGLFPQAAPESVIELDDEAQRIAESLDSMQADYKILELEIEKQKNELRARMGTYETALTSRYKITWKNQKERRMDTILFKREEPALYEKYAPEKEKRVLRLSVRK